MMGSRTRLAVVAVALVALGTAVLPRPYPRRAEIVVPLVLADGLVQPYRGIFALLPAAGRTFLSPSTAAW